MELIQLKDLSPEQLKNFGKSRRLTAEEHAEVARLMRAQLAADDLDRPEAWDSATPLDDLLQELDDSQRRWDEQQS